MSNNKPQGRQIPFPGDAAQTDTFTRCAVSNGSGINTYSGSADVSKQPMAAVSIHSGETYEEERNREKEGEEKKERPFDFNNYFIHYIVHRCGGFIIPICQ